MKFPIWTQKRSGRKEVRRSVSDYCSSIKVAVKDRWPANDDCSSVIANSEYVDTHPLIR